MFSLAAVRLWLGFVTVLVSTQVWAAGLPQQLPRPGQSTALTVSRTSPEYTTISLAAADITKDEVVVDYQTYHAFRLPGEPVLFAEGKR